MTNKLVLLVFFVTLGVVANPSNIQASVVTFGCASSTTCTASELVGQGSIRVGNTQFRFDSFNGFGLSPVDFLDPNNLLVTGLVVDGNPALKFHGEPFVNIDPDLSQFLLGSGTLNFTLRLDRELLPFGRSEFPNSISTTIQEVEFGPFITGSNYQYGFDFWTRDFVQVLGSGAVANVNPKFTDSPIEDVLSHSFSSPDQVIGNLLGVMNFSDVGQFELLHVFETENRIPAVPVPPAFWLFGTALIGLVGFSKRRKAA